MHSAPLFDAQNDNFVLLQACAAGILAFDSPSTYAVASSKEDFAEALPR
jgi:hypothetical protein